MGKCSVVEGGSVVLVRCVGGTGGAGGVLDWGWGWRCSCPLLWCWFVLFVGGPWWRYAFVVAVAVVVTDGEQLPEWKF